MTVEVLACSERVHARVMGSPGRGIVLSAFASAANLSFADGFVLSLNAAPCSDTPGLVPLPLMPNGMLLSACAGNWPFTALQAGMPVVMGAGWLTLTALSCALDCTSCPLWNPHIASSGELRQELLDAHTRLIAQVCQLHRPSGAEDLCIPETGLTLEMLAQQLCGRGPGLTPAGDDFLMGYMAVGWLLYGPRSDFLASCQRVNALARQRTHTLSQGWLACAAAGDVAWPVLVLLHALIEPDPAQVEQATRNVLALGATSGYDLLQGVLYGLKSTHVPEA